MKKKKLKRLLSCALVGTMVAGMMTGCGSSQKSEEKPSTSTSAVETTATTATEEIKESVEVTYPIDTDVTLTVAFATEANVTSHFAGLGETPFWKALEEQTGVDLEPIELTEDALNMMIISGDLPDMIFDWNPYTEYSGGPEMAVADKVLLPITGYEEYAPDLMEVLNTNEDARRTMTTASGEIFGAPFIRGDAILTTSTGMLIRSDWLEELNLEMPRTPDEFYNVLKAFKEQKGATVPFSVTYEGNTGIKKRLNYLTGGVGMISGKLYQVDGKVHYGYAEPEMKDLLAFLNKLYEEELLDPDFATITTTDTKKNITTGRSGVSFGAATAIATWSKAAEDENYDLAGVGPLVENREDKSISGTTQFPVTGAMFAMTPACEHPEIAVQLMNYGYTEEGWLLYNYGIEGESYTMVDGVPTYTDLVLNNPDGWSAAQVQAAYCRSGSHGPMIQDKGVLEQTASWPQMKDAMASWADHTYTANILPTMSIPTEYTAEYSKINSEIETYVDSMVIAYITGAKSLDTFESEYMSTLEALGVDRLIEIQQEALDNYYKK